jgi:hypothetical protein
MQEYDDETDEESQEVFNKFIQLEWEELVMSFSPEDPRTSKTLEKFLRAMEHDSIIRVCFQNALVNQQRDSRNIEKRETPEEEKAEAKRSRENWTHVALTLIEYHDRFILPSTETASNENVWEDDATALHLAATHCCPEAVEKILAKIQQAHESQEDWESVILRQDAKSGQTALAISVDALDLDSVQKLLEATPKFVGVSRDRGGYPLHDLVLTVANPVKTHSDQALNESCLAILKAIVRADKEQALTAQCKVISTTWWEERVEGIPPYTLAVLAERGMERRKLATRDKKLLRNIEKRLPILQKLRIEMKTSIARELKGVDSEKATAGGKSTFFLQATNGSY